MQLRLFSITRAVGLFVGLGLVAGCHKQDFLDKKPSTTLVVPTTLTDFQALLDNDDIVKGMGLTPVMGELSADNFYFTYAYWQSLDTRQYNTYIWAPDLYNGQTGVDDWNVPYSQVFYANVVLDGLRNMKADTGDIVQWNNIKGAALFFRAYAFYNVAQLFAPMYDAATAATDPGIPIRLTSNINAPSTRASVLATYNQVTGDLRLATGLLPTSIPYTFRNRPSRPAAQALLARVYLSMRQYDSAGIYADSALRLYNTLIDYDTLSTVSNFPIARLNVETLYQSNFFTTLDALIGLGHPGCLVDTLLLRSYQPNDLRRYIFYRNKTNDTANLKGTYSGFAYPFSGLATDELYLIRSECRVRNGDVTNAMSDLNTLLRKRWKSGTFTDYTIASPAAALDTILAERRKELVFRGLRWSDLRRLNREGANIKLTRNLNGTIYQLPPNSPLYVLPIPPDVISLGGIAQNPR